MLQECKAFWFRLPQHIRRLKVNVIQKVNKNTIKDKKYCKDHHKFFLLESVKHFV